MFHGAGPLPREHHLRFDDPGLMFEEHSKMFFEPRPVPHEHFRMSHAPSAAPWEIQKIYYPGPTLNLLESRF